MAQFYITHPEVTVDPAVPVRAWGLSGAGRDRAAGIASTWGRDIRHIVTSSETKALDTAEVLAAALGVEFTVDRALGEMDRDSTGFLPLAEFEHTVSEFFAHPSESVRGWERAIDAQARTVQAVRRHPQDGTAFVGHGGVGSLLLADLFGVPIEQAPQQPGLGSAFVFRCDRWKPESGWARIEQSGRGHTHRLR